MLPTATLNSNLRNRCCSKSRDMKCCGDGTRPATLFPEPERVLPRWRVALPPAELAPLRPELLVTVEAGRCGSETARLRHGFSAAP